ncbi:8-oxo-dGTP diphosphatase [Candidatus Nanopelagicus hibericus]|uniref:8-oxo-dGTP diphosphatase n=1 Tax=Candidatus Nanopelagicus hibericus TaxID=1884915 RepID=A0A249KAF6_9ACTN|nr:NUDIX hydrolase [Candidatus Nanopelagicus hibericus]ASY13761.1 8-oxo-dGTP diphosphatase [Candidatus Nanopelagicus hibericus]
MSKIILAAGALVWRKSKEKKIEIAVIHRPKYNDWTIPKGKVELSESSIACAYREVIEETSIETEFGMYLGEVKYQSLDGPKQVSFWSAQVVKENTFTPNSEVDAIKWVEAAKAAKFLSLESDKEILSKFNKLKYESKPLVLLRHAKALSRDEWQGDDDDRPLDSLGQMQAKRLLSIYQAFNLEQIHTSDAIRCYDTVEPMAKALGLRLEVSNNLSESAFKKDKEDAFDYARDLIKSDKRALLCSHNPILPKVLNKLTKKSDVESDEEKLYPADAWVIHRIGKEIIQIDRIDAPTT